MDKKKFIEILSSVKTELRSANKMDNGDFNLCLEGSLFEQKQERLVDLLEYLFEEHTQVTSVILKLDSLVYTLNNFDL